MRTFETPIVVNVDIFTYNEETEDFSLALSSIVRCYSRWYWVAILTEWQSRDFQFSHQLEGNEI